MFYIVTIQSTGESLLFLASASMANNCKIGECQKNSRQSDSFIVLKKLGNANGGKQWNAKQLQREQIAALAHDLKTPLTVIQGNNVGG